MWNERVAAWENKWWSANPFTFLLFHNFELHMYKNVTYHWVYATPWETPLWHTGHTKSCQWGLGSKRSFNGVHRCIWNVFDTIIILYYTIMVQPLCIHHLLEMVWAIAKKPVNVIIDLVSSFKDNNFYPIHNVIIQNNIERHCCINLTI